MAVETLTRAVIRRHCADEKIDERALAARLGIDTTDSTKWEHELEVWARRDVIFEGDNATYRKARHASDGVEHGYVELDEVYRHALAATEVTFGYARGGRFSVCWTSMRAASRNCMNVLRAMCSHCAG